MTTRIALIQFLWTLLLATTSIAAAQTTDPGHASFVRVDGSSFDTYTIAPSISLQQWLNGHFSAMVTYPPYFDTRTSWFPNAFVYQDLYAIYPDSWYRWSHPEWVLHDQNGNWLYIPYGCQGGTCSQFAGDIANPGFRSSWIGSAVQAISNGSYPGLFIDDVNMEFRVSDGWGNQVAPIDSNTGQPMTYDAWRNYVATFLEEIRAALPNVKIMENSIWYAGPAGVQDADPAIRRQIATSDTITLERGVASDPGLTGGTGFWSVYSFFQYVDRVQAAGKGVYLEQADLDPAGQQYGLASYYMISSGKDSIGDTSTTPDNWWAGYDTELGTPLGPRTYNSGVFERDFSRGKVLLGEPGLSPQTVDLGGTYTTLDGTSVSSVSISGSQGIILLSLAVQSAPAAMPIQVFNAASMTAGPVSPGDIVTLMGSITVKSPVVLVNGVSAPVTYAGSNQVNAIVPFGLNLGSPAQFSIQSSMNAAISVPVAVASPSIFTLNATGSGPGAILNQDYSVNSSSNPAPSASVIMVYGTGFGALSPPLSDGQIAPGPASTAASVTATIEGVPAKVLYAGAAPGLIAGVTQINIQVPSGVPTNLAAPISLTIGSFTTPVGATVSVK